MYVIFPQWTFRKSCYSESTHQWFVYYATVINKTPTITKEIIVHGTDAIEENAHIQALAECIKYTIKYTKENIRQ